jgi:hypothetical protein
LSLAARNRNTIKMNTETSPKHSPLVYLLTLGAIGLLAVIFFSPIWWVSLTAPNYPEEAFPDGVRIHFHMNGVFSGCKKVEKREIQEEEALDCVHEMDTINHYVGMYPIAAGGVVERAFSPFLVSLLGVMLIGFLIPAPKPRMAIMAVGFLAILGWMYLYYYGQEGLKYQNEGYLSALVTALDQAAGEEEIEELSPGQALIARLKAELAKTADRTPAPQEQAEQTDKARYIANLRASFQSDQDRRPVDRRQEWNGSGSQMLAWHYEKSLGRYFNQPQQIRPMVEGMSLAGRLLFWGLAAAMVVLVWGARKKDGLLYWLLVLVPMALPLFFVIEYSAWLWWYGHSLNEMGAFTVKPFMPTVFGDGKVAQFATHSYPYIGFGLMLLMSALLAVAALLRRKEWQS